MKRMKTKRFLSLLLALVMSLSLAASAFAADVPDDTDDPDAGIMPLTTIYNAQDISVKAGGSYRSDNFTSTPGNGKYIKVWYANRTDHNATVYLYRVGQSNPVEEKTVAPNDYYEDNVIWYQISDTEPVTFYIRILEQGSNAIEGYLSVAQLPTKTN